MSEHLSLLVLKILVLLHKPSCLHACTPSSTARFVLRIPPLFLKTPMARPIAPVSGVCTASGIFLGDCICSPTILSRYKQTSKYFGRLLQLVQFDRYSSGWSHTASPKARKKFVAFLSQIPPRGPFLPVVPVFNYCTVNNMRFVAFLDTEEVAGSSPVVPTIL